MRKAGSSTAPGASRRHVRHVGVALFDLGMVAHRVRAAISFISFATFYWSDLIKWDTDEPPRWPAGAPDGQGGRFAPKGAAAITPTRLYMSLGGGIGREKPPQEGNSARNFTRNCGRENAMNSGAHY